MRCCVRNVPKPRHFQADVTTKLPSSCTPEKLRSCPQATNCPSHSITQNCCQSNWVGSSVANSTNKRIDQISPDVALRRTHPVGNESLCFISTPLLFNRLMTLSNNGLINIAPPPVLTCFNRFYDWMIGRVEMLSSMFVF